MLIALAAAALVAGATGSWSPCGLSMIATLGRPGDGRGRGATIFACLAFAGGALAGAVLTFGTLALIGSLLGGGDAAVATGAAVALGAAVLEAAGVPIRPQIRRQVPEPWRRILPLPVAAAGYGVLLGLGFTTFVLTFALPALAAVALAVGDPLAGVVIGLAFGAGRALPIVALAPIAGRPVGERACELMTEQPAILRSFRIADAIALTVCAAVLGAEGAESLSTAGVVLLAPSGTDPSAEGTAIAWQTPGGTGRLRRNGGAVEVLAGTNPVVGGSNLAVRTGSIVNVSRLADNAPVIAVDGGGGAVAVSDAWLVLRIGQPDGDRLEAISLPDGARRIVTSIAAPAQIGRPALEGDRLVFHIAGRRMSKLREINLRTGETRTLRSSREGVLLNPSLEGERLLYVHSSYRRQRLKLGLRSGRRNGRHDEIVYSMTPTARRDSGHEKGRHLHHEGYRHGRPKLWPRPAPGVVETLWSTGLAPHQALVARLRQQQSGAAGSELLAIDL
jgi:cytochrome c biogenesis protein CcdA